MTSNHIETNCIPGVCATKEPIVAVENRLTDSPVVTGLDMAVLLNHEVRTSINVIMGFAQILGMNHVDQDELKSYAETIRSESEHLLYLFNEFMDFNVFSRFIVPPAQILVKQDK